MVEIERIRYVSGMSEAWKPVERRVSENNVQPDLTQTVEQVFEYGVNNQASLARRIKVNEWKDSAGARQWQSETYLPSIDGKFQLDSRITVVQSELRDGCRQTTEILEKASPAAPREGLKPVRRIVENLTPVGPDEIQRELEVLEPDLNGAWRTFYRRRSIEVK